MALNVGFQAEVSTAYAARLRVEFECAVDRFGFGAGLAGLADVQASAILGIEGGCHSPLGIELAAQGLPPVMSERRRYWTHW